MAVEAGWVTTEVGRQPWIVWDVMKVADAVTRAPGIRFGYYAMLVFYPVLTVATVYVLRRVARRPLPDVPAVHDEDRRAAQVHR